MRLLPRQDEFFGLFVEVARRNTESAQLLAEMFASEPDRQPFFVDSIKRLEHEADQVTHEVVTRLDRTFITPLDREDIHALATDLDDVLDMIDGTARRAAMFGLGWAPDGVKRLSEIVHRAAAGLEDGVSRLRTRDDIMRCCIEVKRLEEEGDTVYQESLAKLFADEPSAIEVIKWKDIYDMLENTIDQIDDVANILESIAIKHA